MTLLHSFLDNDKRGRWANIRMDNGDPVYVSIAQSGILVKKSRLGIFGAKLYNEKDVYKAGLAAEALFKTFGDDDLTPKDMNNIVLKSVVNAILHCDDLGQVTVVLNEAYKPE